MLEGINPLESLDVADDEGALAGVGFGPTACLLDASVGLKYEERVDAGRLGGILITRNYILEM